MSEREEYTPPMDEIKSWYAGDVNEYWCDTGMSEEEGEMAFDRAIAAHDKALQRKWVQEAAEGVIAHDEALEKALREQIEQQMIERAYFHIAWEKGLTIVPAGNGRAKVPPHWVEAATARLTPYLDIIRGEGSE